MELSLNQVDITKVNLQQGDALCVTLKIDGDISEDSMTELRKMFKKFFPSNEVMIFHVKPNDDIKLTSISTSASISCNTDSYCQDCNCGKKEDFEKSQNEGE